MSSTWVAEFNNEEDYNHFVARFKEIAPDGGNIIVPETPMNPDKVRLRGAWVDLDDRVYLYDNEDDEAEPTLKNPAWSVSFDIAIWDDWTKGFIKALMQEMCRRYSFVEIGCNSAELSSQEEFMKYEIFTDFSIMRRVFQELENQDGVSEENVETVNEGLVEIEKTFRAAAKRFFDGDASDLILHYKDKE